MVSRTEGRGTHCVVEPVRRGALDYFFAYPEDYSQHSVEWVDGQFGQRPHHPAFEVIYVSTPIPYLIFRQVRRLLIPVDRRDRRPRSPDPVARLLPALPRAPAPDPVVRLF